MTTPAKPLPLSDALLARANRLHDAAFANPEVNPKPSWADSVAAAQREADAKTAADAAEQTAADALAKAEADKAAADAAEQQATHEAEPHDA